jgi:outer membrane protein assembly factor BamD
MMLAPRNTSGSFFLSRFGRQVRLALGLTVLAVPLSGCGTGALWDKFMTKEETFVDEPADKLYNEGLYLMNKKGDRKSAMKKFEEVDRQHPYSEWARKSLLMSAYAAYENGDYDECISSANRYVALHPGSPDAAYAQYLIAASNFDQIPDISRDQAAPKSPLLRLRK